MTIKPKRETGLEEIISDEKNEEIIKYILKKSININAKKVKYLGDVEDKALNEYEFRLNKFEVITSKNTLMDIYIRTADSGKIKESVYCYWNIIYEQEKTKFGKDIAILKNIYIRELNIEKYKKEISLEIDDNEKNILKNGTQICFIEIENYLRENNQKLEYSEYLTKFSNLNLFIAKITQ